MESEPVKREREIEIETERKRKGFDPVVFSFFTRVYDNRLTQISIGIFSPDDRVWHSSACFARNVSERRGGWGASSSPLPATKSTRAATYERTPAACTATTTTILSSPPPLPAAAALPLPPSTAHYTTVPHH
ncbi:hypothetical protein V1478_003808 [Vespula squamosa]|uniref:Uncharacterized protein n=1 Tax=Vespula squamosa TaxID=30214 RepID=A0ABD2BNF6_VESSQ